MIIVKFPGIPSSAPVSPNATIKAGQCLGLNSSGQAVLCDGDASDNSKIAIGLAGDQQASLSPGQFTNLLQDYGNDTLASGKMTIYTGPGQYYVDLTDVIAETSVAPGDYLYPSTSAAGKLTKTAGTSGTQAAVAVAVVIDNLAATGGYFQSGIPGVNAPLDGVAVKFALIQWLG